MQRSILNDLNILKRGGGHKNASQKTLCKKFQIFYRE